MRPILRSLLLGCALAGATVPATAAGSMQDWLKQLKQAVKAGPAKGTDLPATDVAAGLKEALAQGTTRAINQLGRTDGFWSNPKVRIPLPGKLEQVASLARQLGQGARVDAFELSMNRAAEQAVPQVADIFGEAIRKMTLDDARGILSGGDHAATDYFRRVAGPALAGRIRPIVARATDRTGVTRKYKTLVSGGAGGALGDALQMLGGQGGQGGQAGAGGAGPLDLDGYVTTRTIDGLFTVIGEQEQAIRRNPAQRTTELLRKVFGGR